MTRTEHNLAARRRGELSRDRESARISPAIDAQRRLNALQTDGTRTNADPFGPNDRRYAYPTRSYDEEGLVRRSTTCSHGGVGDNQNEGELYRETIRRAERVRELAAESLRRSPGCATGKETLGDGLKPSVRLPRRRAWRGL